jgi:hypothetical protein
MQKWQGNEGGCHHNIHEKIRPIVEGDGSNERNVDR